MKHFSWICKVALILVLAGCGRPAPIEVNEVKVETVSVPETVHINNCGGKVASEQVATRSFTVNISGFENEPDSQSLEQNVLSRYPESQNSDKTKKVVAPPGTNMEFNLTWVEEVHTGTISNGNNDGIYNVRIPISIEQQSTRDLGCPTATAAATDVVATEETTVVPVPPTGGPVAELSACARSGQINCYVLLKQVVTTTLAVYFNMDQLQPRAYYLSHDGKKYGMEPVAGYQGKYVCRSLPSSTLGQEIFVQIYTSDSSSPFAEGTIILDRNEISPEKKPTPPGPYER